MSASDGDFLKIPATSLVLLIGAAGSGKSTFAARQFPADAVMSSDQLRARIGAGESDQRVNHQVFEQLRRWIDDQLASGALAVVDATNTDWMRRSELIRSARRNGRPAIAIVFDLPLDVCLSRNAGRSRAVRASVVRRQVEDVRRDRDRLDLEGFLAVYRLRSVIQVEDVRVEIEEGPVARALSS